MARQDPACARGQLPLAATLSSVVSRTLVGPLKLVKMDVVLGARSADSITLAVASRILPAERRGGLWKGNVLNTIRTTMSQIHGVQLTRVGHALNAGTCL